MRADKNNPGLTYTDFWDWLFTGYNVIWALGLAFAYVYYMLTTEEA